MAKEYARLDLLQDVKTAKGPARAIVILRPAAGELMDVLDGDGVRGQIERFVERCCRAEINGELIEFDTTSKIFTAPNDRRTQDYITGRFG